MFLFLFLFLCVWVGLFYVLFYYLGLRFFFALFANIWGSFRFASGWALYFYFYFYIYGKINMGNNGGSLLSLLFNFNFADSFLLHCFVSFCLSFLTSIIIVLGLQLGSITSFSTTVFSILSYPIILYPMQIPLFSILFFSRLLTLHKTLQVFNSHILFTILIYLNLSFFFNTIHN